MKVILEQTDVQPGDIIIARVSFEDFQQSSPDTLQELREHLRRTFPNNEVSLMSDNIKLTKVKDIGVLDEQLAAVGLMRMDNGKQLLNAVLDDTVKAMEKDLGVR